MYLLWTQLYVGEKNESADELDFLHALELLRVAFEASQCVTFTPTYTCTYVGQDV